jgi:hypothetical protein
MSMCDWRDPSSPHHAEYLCQVRVGVVKAFEEVTDDKVRWSLWEALEILDRWLDELAPSVAPKSSVGRYLRVRDQHRPEEIPDAPDDWPLQ